MKIRLSAYAKQSPIPVDEQKRMELDILAFFHDFCQKHNLRYYVCGGTLLGAVRHKGFIPWDDDVDVMLPRSDYERFLRIFPQADTGHYSLVTGATNPDYPYNFAKIEDNRTILFEKSMSYSFSGVFIDVFPLDFLPEPPQQRQKLFDKLDFLYALVGTKIRRWTPRHSKLKTVVAALSCLWLSFVRVGTLRNRIERIVQAAAKTPSPLVGGLSIRQSLGVACYAIAWMDDAVLLPFEHLHVCAPHEYEKVLKSGFGDYMQLPPVEKRKYTHATLSYFKAAEVSGE